MDKRARSLIIKLFLISLAVIMVFLIAGNILGLDSNNVKEYNSETKTITIKNSELEELGQRTLNTPLVYNVMIGKDRKVAEFTIENEKEAENIG